MIKWKTPLKKFQLLLCQHQHQLSIWFAGFGTQLQ